MQARKNRLSAFLQQDVGFCRCKVNARDDKDALGLDDALTLVRVFRTRTLVGSSPLLFADLSWP